MHRSEVDRILYDVKLPCGTGERECLARMQAFNGVVDEGCIVSSAVRDSSEAFYADYLGLGK